MQRVGTAAFGRPRRPWPGAPGRSLARTPGWAARLCGGAARPCPAQRSWPPCGRGRVTISVGWCSSGFPAAAVDRHDASSAVAWGRRRTVGHHERHEGAGDCDKRG